MLGTKFWCIFTLTITMLLSLTTSVLAAQAHPKFDISYTLDDPSHYQFELLLKLVDSYNPSLYSEQKKLVCNSILSEAKATGLDPFFISSIIAAESSFHPNAVSPCEALGLMQLTSCVSMAMHINNPFNIQENIYAGTRFLKYLKTRFGDNTLILAAYNAGPTRVARLGGVPNINETLCYIKKVNLLYDTLRQELYSLIQASMVKPLFCKVINIFTNKTTSQQPMLFREPTTAWQPFTSDFYLCETKSSTRFIVHT
jgi:Transglycosylase SLT domain